MAKVDEVWRKDVVVTIIAIATLSTELSIRINFHENHSNIAKLSF